MKRMPKKSEWLITACRQGALKDIPNGIVIVFGTGIAGGVIIDHKIYLGYYSYKMQLE